MLVYDLPRHQTGSGRPERFAVIGSCRVRNPFLPLPREQAHLLHNQSGFTHTIGEAVQSLRFSNGQLQIPDFLSPYIFSSQQQPDVTKFPPYLVDSIDTFIVEACVGKQIRYRNFLLQQNYFSRNLVQQHAKELLAWYRAFCRGQSIGPDLLAATLEGLAKAGVEMTDELADLLQHARMETLTAEQIGEAMDALVFDRSRRWIFVSHFAWPDDDGATMRERRILAATISAHAERLNAGFFDPTVLLHEFRREQVLDGNGADMFEYAPSFMPQLTEVMLRLAQSGVRPGRLPASGATRLHQVLFDLLSERPAASARVDPVAGTLNGELLKLHGNRLTELGVEGSGLYPHYVAALERQIIINSQHVQVVKLLLDYLPGFDEVVVPRAGIGEVPLLLASLGQHALGCGVIPERAQAIMAGAQHLSNDIPGLTERVSVQLPMLPPSDTGQSRLLLALNLQVAGEVDDHAYVRGLASFNALLVDPRSFIRTREPATALREVAKLLLENGYQRLRCFPRENLIYAESAPTKTKVPPSSIKVPPPASSILVTLPEIHTDMLLWAEERLARMGEHESGLSNFYSSLRLFREYDVHLIETFNTYLSGFEHYVEIGPGLGQCMLMMAALGLSVVGIEANPRRFAALADLQAHLGKKYPGIRSNARLIFGRFPDLPAEGDWSRSIAFAGGFTFTATDEQEAGIIRGLRKFAAVIIDPTRFVRVRQTPQQKDELVQMLRSAGFSEPIKLPTHDGIEYGEFVLVRPIRNLCWL